jgi:hypothetical protein
VFAIVLLQIGQDRNVLPGQIIPQLLPQWAVVGKFDSFVVPRGINRGKYIKEVLADIELERFRTEQTAANEQ